MRLIPHPFFWALEMEAEPKVKKVRAPAKKRAIRHLTISEKAEAIALWKSGSVTLEELARRFKKDQTTFSRLFRLTETKKGETADEVTKKVTEAVTTAIVTDATTLATRIKDTKEDHYKMASGIAKLTWQLLLQARQANQPMGSLATDMKALQAAAQIFKTTREERYALLGISAEDENGDKPLPELIVQELTVEDIKKMHDQKMQSDDELGGLVRLGDEELASDEIENDRIEVE